MGYRAYPEYKEARLESLGNLPKHWECLRLRLLSKRYSGGTPDKKNDFYWQDGTIPWLNSGAVNQGVITQPSGFISELGLKESSAKWVPADAVIIALAGQGKTKGTAAITEIKTTCNQSMAAIIFENDHPKYMYWWLHSQYKNIRGMASDDGRDGLNLEMIGSIPCPRPSKGEQLKIAHFLDYKTAQIDRLIEKKQELIEKLQEQRVRIITQAVTRGLTPDSALKDSGIEWLGKIPKHWQCAGFTKFISSQVDYRGKTPEKVQEGVFLVTAKNIKDGAVNYELSKEYVRDDQYDEIMSRGKPEIGDLLFTTEAPLGEVANIDRTDIALAQRVIKFRGEVAQLDNYFARYWFMSSSFQDHLKSLATGSTALGIKASKLFELRIALPPLEEQVAIRNFLDEKLQALAATEAKITEAIESLREYRTALITAAVTGQIDVRDWQAPEPFEPSAQDKDVA